MNQIIGQHFKQLTNTLFLSNQEGNMGFVNENATEKVVEKYNLKEVLYKFGRGPAPIYNITINHEKDIYLSKLRSGREMEAGIWTFLFYWKGHAWDFDVGVVGEGGAFKADSWLKYVNLNLRLPKELQAQKEDVINDIKEALIVYQEAGTLSRTTSMTITFAF